MFESRRGTVEDEREEREALSPLFFFFFESSLSTDFFFPRAIHQSPTLLCVSCREWKKSLEEDSIAAASGCRDAKRLLSQC